MPTTMLPTSRPDRTTNGVVRRRWRAAGRTTRSGPRRREGRAARRVRPAPRARDGAGHDRGELRSGPDGLAPAGAPDGRGDPAGEPLLTVLEEHAHQLVLGIVVDDVGGAPAVRPHAHVERPLQPVREA